jgi:hypothetical protein
MAEPNLADLRAIETILKAMHALDVRDQVRVLTWVIDKLDLGLDLRVAMRGARSKNRNYVELAWEKVPEAMESAPEFLAAASPASMADRVLIVATFLQMASDDPETAMLTGKQINDALRKMRLAVSNVADCVYTLMKRSPPHMLEVGNAPNRKGWKSYRVTESGIDYVYERIVHQESKNKP